tara:strand:+ start:670 stop:852 length:183 start_codon:yes stop_codon:yes gene_type:complete
MNKVTITKSITYYMTVMEDGEEVDYRTDGKGNWERDFEESWESEYYNIDLEKLFKLHNDE